MKKQKPLIILKVGGSVITDRNHKSPRFRRKIFKRIAAEIAEACRSESFQLLFIHGAGSFGHPIVKATGINKGLKKEKDLIAFGETQRLQTILNINVVRHLLQEGVPAFPFQSSACALMEAGHFLSMDTQALKGLLDRGMVPVLNGVPAYDLHQGCSILSGDQLAGYLYTQFHAKMVLHGTNVKGIYSADPFKNPEALFLPKVDLNNLPSGISGSSVTDVTGGMKKKINELLAVGACGQIFDATTEGNVLKALSGETVGTSILC